VKEKENTWMTRSIMVSINHKWELYLNIKCSNDCGLKDFYKLYCKILTRVTGKQNNNNIVGGSQHLKIKSKRPGILLNLKQAER
jgi:hypothetical protein